MYNVHKSRSNAEQKAIKKIIIFSFQRIGNHMFSFVSYGHDDNVEAGGVVFAICRTQSKFIWSVRLTFCFNDFVFRCRLRSAILDRFLFFVIKMNSKMMIWTAT